MVVLMSFIFWLIESAPMKYHFKEFEFCKLLSPVEISEKSCVNEERERAMGLETQTQHPVAIVPSQLPCYPTSTLDRA